MNKAYYKTSKIIVIPSDEKEHLVKRIRGARKNRNKYYLPLYRAPEVIELEKHGFQIDSYLHYIRNKPPETRFRRSGDMLYLHFPRSDALDDVARELGGNESKYAQYGESVWWWPIEKEEEVREAFIGLDNQIIENNNYPQSNYQIDGEMIIRHLGDLSKELSNGWILYEHQRESIRKVLQTDFRGRILALDYGLGKSLVSSVVAGAIQDIYGYDVIILTPASLIENWHREASPFIGRFTVLSDHFSKIPESWPNPYILLADEAHRLAGYSKRAADFLKLASGARFVIPITGAPVRHGNPATAYNLLRAIDHPIAQMERNLFEARFSGFEADSKRFFALTSADILFRKKRDCLDLPEETRILRQVDVDEESLDIYQKFYNEARRDYIAAVERGEKEMRYINSAAVHHIRQAASLGKIPTALSITEELLEQDRPVVLFCGYKNTVEKISEELGVPYSEITGRIPVKDRQGMVDRFQNGETKVFVCSFGAAGYGVTLTAADTLILIDRPFSVEPKDVDNA